MGTWSNVCCLVYSFVNPLFSWFWVEILFMLAKLLKKGEKGNRGEIFVIFKKRFLKKTFCYICIYT